MTREEQFLDDCRFAKAVTTQNGTGLLIGGEVFEVLGATSVARWLATALRRSNHVGETGNV